MTKFVGQKVRVKIVSLDSQNRLAACSRREVVADAAERLFAAVAEGQVIDVAVKAILAPDREAGKPPRLIVDAGGGFLAEVPRGAATRDMVFRLNYLFHPGQQLKAKVVQADRQSGLIRLNLADLEGDPWSRGYKRGEIVSGVVVSQREGTVFVQVRPGLVGIAGAPLRGSLRKGDRVSCMVTVFNPSQKKMHLRIRGRLA